jgi:glycosyltransferase 2 family protein
MNAVHRHPKRVLLGAIAIAAGTAVLIAAHAGYAEVADRFEAMEPTWLGAAIAGQFAAFVGYALGYRRIVTVLGGPRVGAGLLVRLVATGFGAFALGGGFALDYRALRSLEGDERAATVRVLALGALEYVVIAPAACIAAGAMLIEGSDVLSSVLWPWVAAVPAGFAVGFWLAARHEHVAEGKDGKLWRVLADALAGTNLIRRMASQPLRFAPAASGITLYWAGELVSLWASIRAFGTTLAFGPLLIGLATGYALTRRSMPLAGAGVTEFLLTVALVWVGLDLATALAATIVYRLFSFILPMLPGLWARREVVDLIHPPAATDTPRSAQRGTVV